MLKIGWAQRDVSTEKPVIINGQYYMRISKGILDPVTVTALTMENGGDYVIFLEIDATKVAKGVLASVCEKVAKKNPEINTDKIIMNATHTHTSPVQSPDDYYGDWGKISEIPHDGVEFTEPREYFGFLTDKCAEAVCESFESKKCGSMAYGYGYAAVANHRRALYDPELSKTPERKAELERIGTAKMYGHTELDDFSGYESGPDHFANFMFTFDENENLTGAIVNIPCPSQNCEVEWYISADYWHDVREILRKKYGKDLFVLPQCAAAGDMAPRILHYHEAQLRRYALKFADYPYDKRLIEPYEMHNRRDIALKICDSFDEVYSWAQKEKFTDPKIVHKAKMLELDKIYVSDEEYAKYKARYEEAKANFNPKVTDDPAQNFKNYTNEIAKIYDLKSVCERYEHQNEDKKHKSEVHVVRVGDVAFATNQFELFMDFQHRIQARSPFTQTFIVQLTAQPHCTSGSYLPTKRATMAKGYSAVMESSICSYPGGNQLVEETLDILNEIADKE